MTSTNVKQVTLNKFCLHAPFCTLSRNVLPLPQTREELQGHFFVAGLKETKGNVHVTKSRSQYTDFTSHINITHRNSMQFHNLLIFTNTSTNFLHFISRQDDASNTAFFHCDVHLSKFDRINSLGNSSSIGTATSAATWRVGEESVQLQLEEMDEVRELL